MIFRRLCLLALASVALCLPQASRAEEAVRIGFQKSSVLITVLKAKGTLERSFGKLGLKVQWSEFPNGLPLLEALNVGAIDLSADVADTVPIFAQAAGAKLVYIAQETPSPSAQSILVKVDSPIKSVADLKDKKVGFAKGAGVHYLLLAQLAKAGLKFYDVQPAYLAPADGRAAFENGSIDAWVVWDPFLSAALHQAGARILADGQGLASYRRYYLASKSFTAKHPEAVALLFDELQKVGRWVKANPKEAARLLSPIWGLEADIVEEANSRRSYDVQAVGAENFDEQQAIADAFVKGGVLPKAVKTSEAEIWRPQS